jgi:hypothetical protein
MKHTFLLLTTIAASPFLLAQDNKAGEQQMPDPKKPAHAALATFAGNWTSTCKMAAVPGVAGMEKPSESTGTEQAELICNGLWLKSTVNSTYQGKPFQGVWLAGYDPFANKYKSVWVSTMDESAMLADGTYDEKTKTWTFTGPCPQGGEMRSVVTWKDADTMIETGYMKGADGKESEMMQITRTRAKGGLPADATSPVIKGAEKPAAKELALLAEDVGTWEATVTCTPPGGAPPSTEKGTETITSICDGKWQWSDFKGTMAGQPFEGHGLTGYDETKKQFVSFWLDSMSATHAMTTGTYDEAKKTFTLAGNCVNCEGKPMSINQVYSRPDVNTRNLSMTFKDPSGPSEMKIVYKRKS